VINTFLVRDPQKSVDLSFSCVYCTTTRSTVLFDMSKNSALSIQISTGDSRPIFKQIVDGVRMQIACGDLAVGVKLPSVRGLAMQLTVNPNTVAKAYNELTSQGLVESRQGLGLFVAAPRQMLSDAEQQKLLDEALASFINEVAYLDFSDQDVIAAVTDALHQLHAPKQSQGK
jgi:GntR family transcriptional regulator